MHKTYEYSSVFSELIAAYIAERRASGFLFDTPAYWLFRFDQFCVARNIADPMLTRDLFTAWATISPTETKTTQSNRIHALRGFSLYMNTMGIGSYVPHKLPKPEKNIPYLMDDLDIVAFFKQVDAYEPQLAAAVFERMAIEYKILFRLIYCCGLRNSEACLLKTDNVDITNGILTIIHSKGDKDRVVYVSDDMCMLCQRYQVWLFNSLSVKSDWFFPGRNAEQPIPKTSVDKKFNEFWKRTQQTHRNEKKPSVHCLRHAYVMKRMNLWMESDIDLNVMGPYLSKYLGHKGPTETHYYYHLVQDTLKTIQRKDTVSCAVIPGVNVK